MHMALLGQFWGFMHTQIEGGAVLSEFKYYCAESRIELHVAQFHCLQDVLEIHKWWECRRIPWTFL